MSSVTMRGGRALALLVLCTSLSSCSTLPLPIKHSALNRLSGDAAGILDDGYTDYVGALHIHTRYSHDAHGSFEDVVQTSNAQGLDFAVTTGNSGSGSENCPTCSILTGTSGRYTAQGSGPARSSGSAATLRLTAKTL